MTLVSSAVQTDEIELFIPNGSDVDSVPEHSTKYLPKLGTSLHSLKIIRAEKDNWMSRRTKKCLFMLLVLIAFGTLGLIFFAYYCSGLQSFCNFPSHKLSTYATEYGTNRYTATKIRETSDSTHRTLARHDTTDVEVSDQLILSTPTLSNLPAFEEVISKDFQFDIEGHDVMVFLHIQKTGGTTFGKHLVKNLELERECECHRKIKRRCTCLRPGHNSRETWLFSRYSTGWKCGLHADWTELTGCVDEVLDRIEKNNIKRRYFYITYLREPIHRYLSEYRHVRRGATWRNALHYCNGRPATEEEIPSCYNEEDWSGVSLEEFIACPSNLANNRQTRMLADLSLVNCYNTSGMTQEQRDTILLASAKSNLHKITFFGLTEYQEINQYLFEETFNFRFNIRFEQYNSTRADDTLTGIEPEMIERVRESNQLDIQLYDYARRLLFERFERLRKSDLHFEDHFKKMGHGDFKWEDIDKDR